MCCFGTVGRSTSQQRKHEVGVIAEEVGAVVPEVVSWDKNGKDARDVDYSRLTALLIEATKAQQAMIRKQQAMMRVQQTQIARLTTKVTTIQRNSALTRATKRRSFKPNFHRLPINSAP